MKDNLDEKLKKALNTPQKLDVQKFSADVMQKINEERIKERSQTLFSKIFSRIYSYITLKSRYAIKVTYAVSLTMIALTLFIIVYYKSSINKKNDVVSQMQVIESETTNNNINKILLSTDADKILLQGEWHLISNDPLLQPHSIWEQKYSESSINNS